MLMLTQSKQIIFKISLLSERPNLFTSVSVLYKTQSKSRNLI